MAPESFFSSNVDVRADIFSLGVVAYELQLGRHPFDGSSLIQAWRMICDEDPELPTKLDKTFPTELESIILKMLQKKPENRYQTINEVCSNLRGIIEGNNTLR